MSATQKNTNGSQGRTEWSSVTSIPLSDESSAGSGAEQSIGSLVRDASTHLSTLIRSEVELAKAELSGEIRKGVKGSVYFILALSILAFSLFFLFFTLGELLDVWLPRWSAFGIVFLLMLLAAGLFALLGYRRVRKIHAPQRTIDSLKESAHLTSRSREHTSESPELP